MEPPVTAQLPETFSRCGLYCSKKKIKRRCHIFTTHLSNIEVILENQIDWLTDMVERSEIFKEWFKVGECEVSIK